MLGFEQTSPGVYRATEEQVAWWESRDTCPACVAVVEPTGKTPAGEWTYRCRCEQPAVKWTRPA